MITKRSIRVPIVDSLRFPLWEIMAMLVIVLLLVASVACSAAQLTPSVALKAVNSGLIAVDLTADQRIEAYRLGRAARLKSCREKDLGSPEARAACMGAYTESIAEHVAEASAAYDLAVMAIDALGKSLVEIDRAIAASKEE